MGNNKNHPTKLIGQSDASKKKQPECDGESEPSKTGEKLQ